ncbi:MAG: hypothetical protein K2Q21_10645 [Chitinophagaceae bacterium]|nr:hypothetical protein [Chitinophagaceae bacterium]
MKSQQSIAILTCWYGKYPWYFSYFIYSCKYNPTIDFILITDNQEIILNKPNNVKVICKTLNEIKNIATEKLGFTVSIDYPYKLCDFKPTYGFIFPEIVEGYDFWGHGDIDIVYGDIRNFMTEEILITYDIVSSRHDYITGTFCLFRNNEQINTLFMHSKDYKHVFSNAEHYCFDECNFLFQELQNGASIFDYPNNIQSMTWVVKKEEAKCKLKAFFDFIIVEGTSGKIKWDKGKIIYKDIYEAMFYHLIKFKTECKQPKIFNSMPDTFHFTPTRIIVKKQN